MSKELNYAEECYRSARQDASPDAVVQAAAIVYAAEIIAHAIERVFESQGVQESMKQLEEIASSAKLAAAVMTDGVVR